MDRRAGRGRLPRRFRSSARKTRRWCGSACHRTTWLPLARIDGRCIERSKDYRPSYRVLPSQGVAASTARDFSLVSAGPEYQMTAGNLDSRDSRDLQMKTKAPAPPEFVLPEPSADDAWKTFGARYRRAVVAAQRYCRSSGNGPLVIAVQQDKGSVPIASEAGWCATTSGPVRVSVGTGTVRGRGYPASHDRGPV